MSDERDFIGETITKLKQQRDELAVQIHLGKEDMKDEWEKLQEKLSQLAEDYEPVKDAVEASAGNLFESLKLVAGEIKDGFDRIKASVVDKDDRQG